LKKEPASSSETLVIIYQKMKYTSQETLVFTVRTSNLITYELQNSANKAADQFRENPYALKIPWFLDTTVYI
jgi:hypothetical protein